MALQFSQGNRRNIATNIAITASAPTIKISSNVLFTFSISDLQIRPLVPEPDSENEAHVIDDAAFGASEVSRLTKFPCVGDSYIRSELSADLVTQAKSGIEVRQPGTDSAARIALAVEVHLDLGLQYQALSDQ